MKDQDMRTVTSLIDEAADLCGSQSALARRLGLPRQQISAWKTGDEPISPENVALLCDVLELSGEETRRLAAIAIVANPKNAKKAEVLRRAFFVSLALGVVGLAQLAYTGETMAATPDRSGLWITEYTLCALIWLLLACRRRAGQRRTRSTTRAMTAASNTQITADFRSDPRLPDMARSYASILIGPRGF